MSCGKPKSSEVPPNPHSASDTFDKPFKCKIFNKSFKAMTKKKHMLEKAGCGLQKKIFKSEINIAKHKKRFHTLKKNECGMCFKTLNQKLDMRPITKKHIKQENYNCNICSKGFFNMRTFKKHLHSHRKAHEHCQFCGKFFYYKKILDRHMITCSPDINDITFGLKGSFSQPNSRIK